MNPDSSVDSAPRQCILLVDDTPANIDILVGVLKADYDLKIANSGAKALSICGTGASIDLILLDVMMPMLDGFEVCRILRSSPATADIPIIFLTAKTELEDIVHGFEIGANDYVPKPFRPPELRARVRTQLMIRAQQKEIEKKNTELKEMLHLVCHDVANQFAVLSMSFKLIKEDPDQKLSDFLPRMSVAIKNGIELTHLVRDLRRSEDIRMNLEAVALRPSLADSLLLMEDKLREKKLRVLSEVPDLKVMAEPCSLNNSVFGNILSNAIKFSPRGSLIEIKARSGPDTICISFRDHGIGMPPKIIEKLFDVGHSHSRRGTEGEKGTGFGMPLMHRFVTQFGGKVEVDSRDIESDPGDHGTEFRIHLRLAKD
jgi:signal transduction histidine kinase